MGGHYGSAHYGLALAKLGSGPRRIRDVAAALDQKVERINWIRNQLIKKEIIDKFLLRNDRESARRLG